MLNSHPPPAPAPKGTCDPLALLVTEGKLVRAGTRRGARYRLAGSGKTLRQPRPSPPPGGHGHSEAAKVTASLGRGDRALRQ